MGDGAPDERARWLGLRQSGPAIETRPETLRVTQSTGYGPRRVEVRGTVHVTGGGIPGNLVRILPETVDAVVDRATWKPQPIFDLIQAKGRIEDPEMEATFNMGVGMFAIVSAEDADRALATLAGRGVDAWQAGEVIEGAGNVRMVGQHTRG